MQLYLLSLVSTLLLTPVMASAIQPVDADRGTMMVRTSWD